MIPVSFAFFLCFSFLQKSFHYYFFIYIYIFHENYFYFFMLRYAPECSGMFRVPCFIDALSFRACLHGVGNPGLVG